MTPEVVAIAPIAPNPSDKIKDLATLRRLM